MSHSDDSITVATEWQLACRHNTACYTAGMKMWCVEHKSPFCCDDGDSAHCRATPLYVARGDSCGWMFIYDDEIDELLHALAPEEVVCQDQTDDKLMLFGKLHGSSIGRKDT